jgi:hypothetical protein
MLEGGTRTAFIGLGMHVCVALTWSVVFLILFSTLGWLRAVTSSRAGVFGIAVVYGPLVWMTMSFVVIQHFTQKPPVINYRWWVQFFGHIPFVALPIVASIARGTATADPSIRSG